MSRNTSYLLRPSLCFFIVLNRDLFVYRDDSLISKRLSSGPNNQLNVLFVHKLRTRLDSLN